MEMSLSYEPTVICSCQEHTYVSVPSASLHAWEFTALLFTPITFRYNTDGE